MQRVTQLAIYTRWTYVQDECHQFTVCDNLNFSIHCLCKYLKTSKETFSCGSMVITPSLLRHHAKRQICFCILNAKE